MKINTRTTLTAIQQIVKDDFGLLLTRELAKDIKESCLNGSAIWKRETENDLASFKSTRGSAWIVEMSPAGVVYSQNREHFSASEWNKAVRTHYV